MTLYGKSYNVNVYCKQSHLKGWAIVVNVMYGFVYRAKMKDGMLWPGRVSIKIIHYMIHIVANTWL